MAIFAIPYINILNRWLCIWPYRESWGGGKNKKNKKNFDPKWTL